MRDAELRVLAALAGRAIARPALIARDVHAAAAGRTFKALGVLGAPVRTVHDTVSRTAYRSVDHALEAPLVAGAAALVRAGLARGASLADSTGGSLALGALNGAFGDALAREHRELALGLTLRSGGRDLELDPTSLAQALPEATPRIAVFVHGLCETDDAWRIVPAVRGASRRSYGQRLRDELGYTPVYVRYNTGLHVSDNGRRLAASIDELVRQWPVDVHELILVGHSMGGLVARSACHYGRPNDPWVVRLRHVFCLGTPHLGAPLEKAANVAGWALGRLAEARPFADVVNARSAGIKDLRFGSCVEDDWCDCDPNEFLRDRCREVPFLASASYYFIGATLTREPDSGFGSTVGDLLVRFGSASGEGRSRRIGFEIENGRHLGGVNHFQLLNHPAVYEQMRAWLVRPPLAAAAELGP